MRIGEVAKRAKLTVATLRYYEEIGLIAPPRRVNGQRSYDEGVFEVLATIRLAQRAGFTLKEIRSLLNTDAAGALSARWRPIAEQKVREVKATIREYQARLTLLEQGLNCTCTDLTDCVLH